MELLKSNYGAGIIKFNPLWGGEPASLETVAPFNYFYSSLELFFNFHSPFYIFIPTKFRRGLSVPDPKLLMTDLDHPKENQEFWMRIRNQILL